MTASIRTYLGVCLAVVMVGTASAAGKPDGGQCACDAPVEAPALCGSLNGAERDICIADKTEWLDACVAWRGQTCHAQSPAPVKLVAHGTSLPKFVGAWTGKTVCRKLGTARLMMSIVQQHNGSFVTKASTDGAGEFREIAFKENQVTLAYSSLFRDISYTGRLTAPDRIEGSVRISTEGCSWYLER
jgi:hypothetical protein